MFPSIPSERVFLKSSLDMSKASQSTKFRGVDVDELDENTFQDDGDEDSGQSGPDEGEVSNLLMQYPFMPRKARSLFHILAVYTTLLLGTKLVLSSLNYPRHTSCLFIAISPIS